MEKSGNEIDRYRHPIYIGCACIYLTSMLLAGRQNRYGRQYGRLLISHLRRYFTSARVPLLRCILSPCKRDRLKYKTRYRMIGIDIAVCKASSCCVAQDFLKDFLSARRRLLFTDDAKNLPSRSASDISSKSHPERQ